MRNRQPRFPVNLPQLRRCELMSKQLVEELRDLERTADDDPALEASDIRAMAMHVAAEVDAFAKKHRPYGWTSPMQQRAEIRQRIARRKQK